MKELILASKSPRRFELLSELGLAFKVQVADVDESKVKTTKPSTLVKRLSYLKAMAVFKQHNGDIVIGSDTIVYLNKVYGKPGTKENAIKMIQELNGKWHTVYTGVTILSKDKVDTYYVKNQVKFKHLSLEQIKEYVDKYNPIDKAGSYGIQDEMLVEKYKGSLSNIIGLPIEGLKTKIKSHGDVNGNN